jgi:glucose-1-phosphate cytidylyltransferase
VLDFREKAKGDGALINGGFMVCESGIMDYIDGDMQMLEREPLERLAKVGELMAYAHDGFWRPMDTVREREYLESLWAKGRAPWKIW